MVKRRTYVVDDATIAALDALVAAGSASSASEGVRRAVAALVASELPTWRYRPPADPRQLEIPGSKKDHFDP